MINFLNKVISTLWHDNYISDVWSLGVILFMMVCGRGPFSHANDNETMTMIMDCKYEVPETLSEECKRLVIYLHCNSNYKHPDFSLP